MLLVSCDVSVICYITYEKTKTQYHALGRSWEVMEQALGKVLAKALPLNAVLY